jgi:hypothetical protein
MSDPERFVPSRHGFAFTNDWPSQPAVVLATHLGQINIGNAAAGLCGGMVFVVLDYWHAAIVPPTTRPVAGETLYRQIVGRLIESWNMPTGIAQYFQCMNLPDSDIGIDVLGRQIVIDQGLTRRTVQVQWPRIKADLDRGVPVPLGVVTVASSSPADLALNHQVLAYGYDRAGTEVTVRVYDPNRGQRNDIWIRFDESAPTKSAAFTHNLGIGRPVRGFFRTAYSPVPPWADLGGDGRLVDMPHLGGEATGGRPSGLRGPSAIGKPTSSTLGR